MLACPTRHLCLLLFFRQRSQARRREVRIELPGCCHRSSSFRWTLPWEADFLSRRGLGLGLI